MYYHTKPVLKRATEINWASDNFARGGVIPIYDDGTHTWLGLGVNKYTSALTTIGGAYIPEKDHDLIETIIREYQEEVGNNLPKLTLDNIMSSTILYYPDSIISFIPLKAIPPKFVETDELKELIWITTEQFLAMGKNQHYRHNNVMIYGFSSAMLLSSYQYIAEAIQSKEAFKQDKNAGCISRPKRVNKEKEVVISWDIYELEKMIKNRSTMTYLGIIQGRETVKYSCVLNKNETNYIFMVTDHRAMINMMKKYLVTVLVPFDSYYKMFYGISHKISVEFLYSKGYISFKEMLNFVNMVFEAHDTGSVVDIVNAIEMLLYMENISYQNRPPKVRFNRYKHHMMSKLNEYNEIFRDNYKMPFHPYMKEFLNSELFVNKNQMIRLL